ncbi:MAG: hypothetical protein PHV20_08055 [Bacteroidales bacterium]|nr:hypothetical protein [Bacteroidales bacterium]
MFLKFIRLIIASLLIIGSVFLYIYGWIFTGVMIDLLASIFVLLHFKNEKNLLAFYFVRKNNIQGATLALNYVKRPELMIKSQEAYFYYLRGLVESQQRHVTKAEKSFKKALSTGLRMKNDQAVAKLNLAAIALSQRNKKVAMVYLESAKKLDKQKLLTAQIREIEMMMKKM